MSENDKMDMYEFIDPEDVIWSCHLIPAFSDGFTTDLPLNSLTHRNGMESDDNDDYAYFYVNQ